VGFGYLKQAPSSVLTAYHAPLRIASLVLAALLLATLWSLYSALRAIQMREREQEQLLHLVMQSTKDLNALVDENGRILRVNKASQSILGVPMEEAIGLDLTSMLKPHVRHQLSNFQGARILQSLAEDAAEEHRCFLRRYKRPMLPCLVSVRTYRTVDARTEYLVIIHDYSGAAAQEEELTSAVSQAEAAGRAKSAFLSMISHELRSPVASVSAALRFVEEHVKDIGGRKVLRRAQRSTGLLLSIIDDILDYSRLEAEQLTLSPEPMRLRDALRDVVDVLHWSAEEAGVELITECDDTLPTIHADALRIRQVLINLIGNAVKFSARLDHKGEVRVALTSRNRTDEMIEVTLRVADNGIGIEEDQVAEMFAPFTQGKNEDRRAKGGAGLGLSIVARLVALMDGSIDVNSKKGVGTQFTVNLCFPISKDTGRVVRLHTASQGMSASKLIS
jgi:PAS domain S-box-containing protein